MECMLLLLHFKMFTLIKLLRTGANAVLLSLSNLAAVGQKSKQQLEPASKGTQQIL